MAPTIEPGPFLALDGPACSASYRPSDGLSGPGLEAEIDGVVGGIKDILDSEWAGVRTRAALAKIAALGDDGGDPLAAAAKSKLTELRESFPRMNLGDDEQEHMALRTLVIADFDRHDFLGLKRRATPKELAVLSILAGSIPGTAEAELSVAEMLRLEEKAMRQARDRRSEQETTTPRTLEVRRAIRCGSCSRDGEIRVKPLPPGTPYRYLCSHCGAVLEAGVAAIVRDVGNQAQPRS
jgi:hypothetical protein